MRKRFQMPRKVGGARSAKKGGAGKVAHSVRRASGFERLPPKAHLDRLGDFSASNVRRRRDTVCVTSDGLRLPRARPCG
jgi:hypothetical protein